MKTNYRNKEFYFLALSQNKVQLFHCTSDIANEIHVKDLPENLSEVMGYDYIEKQLQAHSSTGQGDRSSKPIFHGHGAGSEHHKDNILHLFRRIDKGLHELLHNKKTPLIIGGVDYLLPIYRKANTYPHLLEDKILGNLEKLNTREIHEKAWPIVRSYFNALQR